MAADERLWEVAELARRLDLADVVLELPAEAAHAQLRETMHGRQVLSVLEAYLGRYGGRARLHELSEPREAERPDHALERVRLFLEPRRDLPTERRARADERDRLERDVLDRIGDQADRRAFAALLQQVKAAVPLEETHAYHIDYPGLLATREALLGFGRRLVAEGRLDEPGDVFYLGRDEVRHAVLDSWGRPLQSLVAGRRAERERAARSTPLPYLGPPPADVDVSAMVSKFYGVPGTARRHGDILRGTPASPGQASGVARVVRGAEDFARLRPGDVLVSTTTTPAWTPLFGSLAALVTDTGGILCHAAVVAREYGLPAVVGAEVATQVIPDGARVEVDGDAGEVRLLR
jgi:pyruvate,water dikinase